MQPDDGLEWPYAGELTHDQRFDIGSPRAVGRKSIKSSEDSIVERNETMTNPGLQIEQLTAGTGEAPKTGDRVSVHYTGWLTNGTKFDSSVDRGQPFVFTLGVGQVIRGWGEGVAKMRVGEKSRLTIPPDMGYGARGAGGVIPPNADLHFDVELLGVD